MIERFDENLASGQQISYNPNPQEDKVNLPMVNIVATPPIKQLKLVYFTARAAHWINVILEFIERFLLFFNFISPRKDTAIDSGKQEEENKKLLTDESPPSDPGEPVINSETVEQPQPVNQSQKIPEEIVLRIVSGLGNIDALSPDDQELMPSFCNVIEELGPQRKGAISGDTQNVLLRNFNGDQGKVNEFIGAIKNLGDEWLSSSGCPTFNLALSWKHLRCLWEGTNEINITEVNGKIYSGDSNITKAQVECDRLFEKIINGNFHLLTDSEKESMDSFCKIIKCAAENQNIPFDAFEKLRTKFNDPVAAIAFIAQILARHRKDIKGDYVPEELSKPDYAALAEQTNFHIAESDFRNSCIANKVAFFVNAYRRAHPEKGKLALATSFGLRPGYKFSNFSEFLTPDGLLDKNKLEETIVEFIACKRTSSEVYEEERLERLLQIYENLESINGSLEFVTFEKFKKNITANKLAMFTKWESTATPEERTTALRKLAFSATFDTTIKQEIGVASCFVIAPLIHLQAAIPEKMLSLMANALANGRLPLFNSQKQEIEIPLNVNERETDKRADITNKTSTLCAVSLQNAIARTLADGELQGSFYACNLMQVINGLKKLVELCRGKNLHFKNGLPLPEFLDISYDMSANNAMWNGAQNAGVIFGEDRGVLIPHMKMPGGNIKFLRKDELLNLLEKFKLIVGAGHFNGQGQELIAKNLDEWISIVRSQNLTLGGNEGHTINEIHGQNCIGCSRPRVPINSPLDVFTFFYGELLATEIASAAQLTDGNQAVNMHNSVFDIINASGQDHAYTVNKTGLRKMLKKGMDANEALQEIKDGSFIEILNTNWQNETKFGFLKQNGALHFAKKYSEDNVQIVSFELCPKFLKNNLRVYHIIR
jgi:hypothetical protein